MPGNRECFQPSLGLQSFWTVSLPSSASILCFESPDLPSVHLSERGEEQLDLPRASSSPAPSLLWLLGEKGTWQSENPLSSESPPSSLTHSLPRKAAEGAAAKTSHLLEAQQALVLAFSVPSPIYSRHRRNMELKLLPLLQMSSQQPSYSTITSSSYSHSSQHPHVLFAPAAARHQALRCQLFATSFSCFSWALNHLLSSKC